LDGKIEGVEVEKNDEVGDGEVKTEESIKIAYHKCTEEDYDNFSPIVNG